MDYIDRPMTATEAQLRHVIAVHESAHRAHMQPMYDALARELANRAPILLLTREQAERFGMEVTHG